MCNGMGKWKDVHRRHAAALYVRHANTASGRHPDRLRRYRNEPGDHSTAWVWRRCPAAAGAVEAASAGAGIRHVAVATQLEDGRQYAEIQRASWRERVCQSVTVSVGCGSVKNKRSI